MSTQGYGDEDSTEEEVTEPTVAECQRLATVIVDRRYWFEMPEWLWAITPDSDLRWALTHYLMSSTVAFREAQETERMYKGARRYKLGGKVTYHK